MSFTCKQKEFNEAMQKYHKHNFYQYVYRSVAIINISLEVILLYILSTLSIAWVWIIPLVLLAYFLTDFINGLVHLYMDHKDNYSSSLGVFTASFHLHHRTPEYKKSNVFTIYFNESGPKFWLAPYLVFVFLLSTLNINHNILFVLISIGILSSFAEVSHYLCHNSKSEFILFLQKIRILLPMKHHKKHHNEDNNSYAFLNGMSDFLIDIIAKNFYKGYKEHSDKDYEAYKGEDTKNREDLV